MEVIPLTLVLSLLLSLTFIALFLREFTRPRRAGAEHDSLLPLEPDFQPARPATISAVMAEARSSGEAAGHHHAHEPGRAGCAKSKTGAGCCDSCKRRREDQAGRVADGAPAAADSLSQPTQP